MRRFAGRFSAWTYRRQPQPDDGVIRDRRPYAGALGLTARAGARAVFAVKRQSV
jgi:hypothetical protein